MAARTPHVTDAELAVLEALWQRGGATIRELTATLYPAATDAQYATVQKLLERLEAKDCVTRQRAQPAHVFRAIVARETLIGAQLSKLADRLCDGSLTPLLTHLVGAGRLSKRDREHLRQLLDRADRARDRKE
jgi:predicted transcriptional regulator